LITEENFWTYYANSVQDVPMMYVHFVIILIIVSEKIEGIKSVKTFVLSG